MKEMNDNKAAAQCLSFMIDNMESIFKVSKGTVFIDPLPQSSVDFLKQLLLPHTTVKAKTKTHYRSKIVTLSIHFKFDSALLAAFQA